MDTKAFRAMSYGMYLIASGDDQGQAGCVVNTFEQITSSPSQTVVAVNKDNFTSSVIRRTGRYTIGVLGESAPMELIGRFGFHTSVDFDKFSATEHTVDAQGLPTVTDHAVSTFQVRVTETIDAGSHWLFIGSVEDAQVISHEAPMTYAYYHQVKGGKTPPKASSYIPEDAQAAPKPADAAAAPASDAPDDPLATNQAPGTPGTSTWRCTVCGYELTIQGDTLPADYVCPICGSPAALFERIA